MNLEEYLIRHAQGLGKTHHLAKLVSGINGTLVVSSQNEQNLVHERYGIKAIPYNVDATYYAGLPTGIMYVDPSTVGEWVLDLKKKIYALEVENAKLKEMLNGPTNADDNTDSRHGDAVQ